MQLLSTGGDPKPLYPDLTLAIHPLRPQFPAPPPPQYPYDPAPPQPAPHAAPVHPLSRRYQTLGPGPGQHHTHTPPLSSSRTENRIENLAPYLPASPQPELHQAGLRPPVSGDLHQQTGPGPGTLANNTKDTQQQQQQQQQQVLPRTQSIRSATEKLKWKFLGW